MRTFRKLVMSVCMLLCGASAFAGSAGDVEAETMLKLLRSKLPATAFTSVTKSRFPGLFEVVMGKTIAYVEPTGRFFIFGHVYDTDTRRDLSQDVLDDANRVDVSALPLKDAIKEVVGAGESTLVVFSDPDCPYCRQLETSIGKLENVTIYTFLMPLAQLHPGAVAKSKAIWCSPNAAKALHAYMADGRQPADSASCGDTPIDRNLKLAAGLGITGTPTLVLSNGKKIPGAIPADRLRDLLLAKGEQK